MGHHPECGVTLCPTWAIADLPLGVSHKDSGQSGRDVVLHQFLCVLQIVKGLVFARWLRVRIGSSPFGKVGVGQAQIARGQADLVDRPKYIASAEVLLLNALSIGMIGYALQQSLPAFWKGLELVSDESDTTA